MNKNVLIVLAGAVVVAVLMAVLVQMMMGGKKPEVVVADEPRSEILVASKDLKMGTELAEGDIKWQSWPKTTLFAGAVVRKEGQAPLEALSGRLRRDLAEGEPVMVAYIIGESQGNLVAAMLEPGQRAVAIEVSAETMVAGFVAAGDFVDVVLTYNHNISVENSDPLLEALVREGINRSATETILQNVKVLAIDQLAQRPEEDKIKVGKTVTLALSAADAEKIIQARQMGELTLLLRGVGDEATVQRSWPVTSDVRIVNAAQEIYENYNKLKNEAGISGENVRIYSGDAVQVVPAR
jgi:pilus assembly protein CpaB